MDAVEHDNGIINLDHVITVDRPDMKAHHLHIILTSGHLDLDLNPIKPAWPPEGYARAAYEIVGRALRQGRSTDITTAAIGASPEYDRIKDELDGQRRRERAAARDQG